MEKRDLYDNNKKPTGETIYKGEKHPENSYILVVMVFIENSKGEFLIQKRSKEKDGKYGFTGGHPKTGETSLQGMITEIKEEIGLKVKEEELKLIYAGKEEEKRVFFDIYYMKKDIDIKDLKLQKEEVEFVKWYSLNKIIDLIEKGEVLESHAEELYRIIEILDKK